MSDVNLSELKDKLMALLEDEHQVKILEWWDKIFHFFFGDNPELSRFHRLYLIADRNSDGSVTFLLLLATLVVYALGVLMNVMMTGKHPSIELAPGRLGRVIKKCIMVNPDDRYKDVVHLMEVL